MRNSTATLEDTSEAYNKLQYGLTYNPAIVFLGVYQTGLKTLGPHKNMHVNVYSQSSKTGGNQDVCQ